MEEAAYSKGRREGVAEMREECEKSIDGMSCTGKVKGGFIGSGLPETSRRQVPSGKSVRDQVQRRPAGKRRAEERGQRAQRAHKGGLSAHMRCKT